MELLDPTDVIDVKFVPVMLFGPPGVGKTAVSQTAKNPLTLDFDRGIHRCANRQRALRFDSWAENIEAGGPNGEYKDPKTGQIIPYDTLVIDTGGRALDTMIPAIIKENAKNGYQGSLTPQGWGVLGSRFSTWMKTVASWGKEVVFICHQEEAKNAGGDSYFLPDLPGKMSYKEIHKSFDLIGRISYEGKTRFLDFNPSDNSIGKNAAGWERIVVPDLHKDTMFLANLIADAKQKIGQISSASAEVAKAISAWKARLDPDVVNLDNLNGEITASFKEISKDDPLKPQVWALLQAFATSCGCVFDRTAGKFVVKEAA